MVIKAKTIRSGLCCPAIVLAVCFLVACESVKPYQKAYLNDREMKLGVWGARKFEENVHAYREGASGGGSSKSSGGCGCN